MNSRQQRVLASIANALSCLKLPLFQLPRLTRLREELAAKRREIESLGVTQHVETHRSSGLEKIESLRGDLRARHLMPISREGKRLLKGMPGIDDALRIPHKRAKDDELLDASARILENVEPHAAVFRKALFHRDFIKRARRAADALAKEQVINANRPPARGSRATTDLKVALAEGREIIRSIDGLIEAEFFGNSAALQVWKGSKRVPKKMGRPKKRRPGSSSEDQAPA
jgi:hypothetical protein